MATIDSEQMVELCEIVDGVDELNALPGSALRLTALLAGGEWELKEIVHVIQYDQALTGRLLKLVNSAAYSAMKQIDSVSDAVARVGTGPVLALALGAAVRDDMQKPVDAFGLAEGVLWQHSVASALVLVHAGEYCDFDPTPDCFVAGLLHDIGRLVLDRFIAKQKASSPGALLDPSADPLIKEIDHGILGGLITGGWNLSPRISNALGFHHSPMEALDPDDRTAASFVALADCVAGQIGQPAGEKSGLTGEVAAHLGVSRKRFDRLCEVSANELEEFLALYS